MTLSTRIAALCAVALVTVLMGCNTGGGLPPLDKSQIVALVTVEPGADDTSSGPTAYSAYCTFRYESGTDEVDVASAIVKVNGVTLPNFPSVGPYYFFSSNVGSLNAGDVVPLSITQDRLGVIEASATVPASVTSFTLNPLLPTPAGTANSASSYTMSWTPNEAGHYYLALLCFYADTTYASHGGYGYTLSGTTRAFTSADTYWDAANSHFLKFKLETLNSAALPGFASWSAFRVSGVTRPTLTNM